MPKWINAYTVAGALGVVFLTAMPFLSKRFLKAPPPIAPMGVWSLPTLDGRATLGSDTLRGKVVLVTVAPGPCDAACVEKQRAFGRGLEHTDDLKEAIQLVTITRASAAPVLAGLAIGRWHVLSGTDEQVARALEPLFTAWSKKQGTDAGVSLEERLMLPAITLIDQNGDVRDFWRDDNAGRGNAINAARLLAQHGPNP